MILVVYERLYRRVRQPLMDGGYMRREDIGNAGEVELFLPPQPARSNASRGHELEPRPGEGPAIQRGKQRMADEEGKDIYKQRAATSKTINADLRTYRGISQITVRGSGKVRGAALWCALACNVFHFAQHLLG